MKRSTKPRAALRMKILCLEFSSLQRSVAVVVSRPDGTVAMEAEVVESGARTTRALGMIDDALRQSGLEREQLGHHGHRIVQVAAFHVRGAESDRVNHL